MTAGWPDSVIIGTHVIYRELKAEHGQLSPEQRAVGDKLKAAGADWKVWATAGLAQRRHRDRAAPAEGTAVPAARHNAAVTTLPRCPSRGCPIRYRGGPDRPCPAHQAGDGIDGIAERMAQFAIQLADDGDHGGDGHHDASTEVGGMSGG
jgi:hypothetical protein